VVLLVVTFSTVVASRRSQVALARENAARFRELAIHDDLTGLFNRRYFTSQLEREVERCVAAGAPLSLAVLDVDGFKAINDTLGHAGGDLALQTVGHAILQASPRGSTAARIGGDEFAVILPGHSRTEAGRVNATIQAALTAAGVTFGEQQRLEIRATIGLATLEPGRDGSALLREADSALYAGKRTLRAA
jgi:diguanylate cyclase (GGDEF)-like protein